MQLISKYNKGIQFLSCVTDIFRKHAWVFSLEDRKGITFTNSFQRVWNESGCKPNEIWLHKGSEFYSVSVKSYRNVFNK